jgi:hypothetical protein
MNKQVAQMAIQFLSRVQLRGDEAPALMQVMAALEGILQAEEMQSSEESPKKK